MQKKSKRKNGERAMLSPHEKYLLGVKKKKALTRIWQLLVLVVIVGMWELLTAVGALDAFFMSSPSRIA